MPLGNDIRINNNMGYTQMNNNSSWKTSNPSRDEILEAQILERYKERYQQLLASGLPDSLARQAIMDINQQDRIEESERLRIRSITRAGIS